MGCTVVIRVTTHPSNLKSKLRTPLAKIVSSAKEILPSSMIKNRGTCRAELPKRADTRIHTAAFPWLLQL